MFDLPDETEQESDEKEDEGEEELDREIGAMFEWFCFTLYVKHCCKITVL